MTIQRFYFLLNNPCCPRYFKNAKRIDRYRLSDSRYPVTTGLNSSFKITIEKKTSIGVVN